MGLLSKNNVGGDEDLAKDFHFPTSKKALIIFTRHHPEPARRVIAHFNFNSHLSPGGIGVNLQINGDLVQKQGWTKLPLMFH